MIKYFLHKKIFFAEIIYAIKDNLSEIRLFRYLFKSYHLVLAVSYYLKKDYYLSLKACCRVKRLYPQLSEAGLLNKLYNKLFSSYILKNGKLDSLTENIILRKFLESKECKAIREEFLKYDTRHITSLKYPRNNDYAERQGNLLILKKSDPQNNEKGVIYLKYTEYFKKFIALFDLTKISQHYRIVLEPSTFGYMEEHFHLFIGKGTDVIVLSQTKEDFEVIQKMNVNLIPIRLGAGDWIDTDIFDGNKKEAKIYDVVMIASWLKIKRHKVLFEAIAKSKLDNIKIALIGYPWGGRTRNDIEREANKFNVLKQIDFYENITPQKVSEILQKSKVAVMLTKREGANRGIYECLLSGVPVVIYKYNRGVNKDLINAETGRLADDDELGDVLREMIKNYAKYDTVAWAKKNTGRIIAHSKLNALLKSLAHSKGEDYTVDICEIKASNAAYVNDDDRINMGNEYLKLSAYLIK